MKIYKNNYVYIYFLIIEKNREMFGFKGGKVKKGSFL